MKPDCTYCSKLLAHLQDEMIELTDAEVRRSSAGAHIERVKAQREIKLHKERIVETAQVFARHWVGHGRTL